MSADFWWGVAAATVVWFGMAGSTILTFSWLVSRTRDQGQPAKVSDSP